MSYVVLARKYRPQSFDDLVGQSHVSTTLGNAIDRGRVAHAFLFTGVRGVGKTTSARILAKALNCAKGPTPRPCQVCPQCTEITIGSDVDVQEIDGASYNGVDEVRRLQESLPYRPSRDRFKIFIVDEVHMLSNAAWNAFLKTLEEPPPHVKFIFATTEVHKVPVTILSRCQRYDFKLITAQTIASRLRYVLEQEGFPAEDTALSAIAREAAGSMRDAMSLLDQVIAWVGTTGEKLTAEGVARVLGVADRTVLHKLAGALVAGDAAGCVRVVGELAQEGYDLPHVARDFMAQLRDLVIAKVCEDPTALLDLAGEEIADVKALAARADADDLTRLHQGFSRSYDDIVRSGQPRAALEMALVRLARRPALLPVDELLRRLGDMERRLAGGGSGAAGGAPPGGSGYGQDRGAGRGGAAAQAEPRRGASAPVAAPAAVSAPAPVSVAAPAPAPVSVAAPAPVSASGPVDAPAPAPAPVSAPAPVTVPEAVSVPAPAPTPAAVSAPVSPPVSAPVSAPVSPPVAAPAPAPAPRPAHASPPSSNPPRPILSDASTTAFSSPTAVYAPRAPASLVAASSPAPSYAPSRPSNPAPPPAPQAAPPPAQRAGAAAPAPAFEKAPAGPDFDAWRSIVDSLRATHPRQASIYNHASLLQVSPDRIVLGFDAGHVLHAQAIDPSSRELLLAAARAHFKRPVEIIFENVASRGGSATIAQAETAERRARIEAARRSIMEHPLVTAAIEIFGAEIKDVRLSQDLAEG